MPTSSLSWALYRPGPLTGGMVDEYVDVKHGRKQPTYPHPVMKEVLEETYAVMVYQEQIMHPRTASGGIELSAGVRVYQGDLEEEVRGHRPVEDAVRRGAPPRAAWKSDRAEKIFDLIEHFGGYGFNKSHSTAYALLAYQTAYLKANYPTEFMAALLSSEMDGAEREKYFVEHIDDCKLMGIEVLAPDINQGGSTFKVAAEGKISFGLGAIKGVGFKAVDAIAAARAQGGRFHGLDDLFERVPLSVVSQSCVEALIKAGQLDSLGGRRSQWLAVLRRAAQAGQAVQEDRKRGQRNSSTSSPSPAAMATVVATGMPGGVATVTLPLLPSRTCPIFPNCPMPSAWPKRRRCSASTCRATP